MKGHGFQLRIKYSSRDFPAGLVPRSGDLSVDWGDVLWAALTIGRPNTAYVFKHGDASLHEALFRISLMRMAITQSSQSHRLRRTAAFEALDPTEKGAVSYFLGMTFCKLFASQLLQTDWLLHLDVFRGQFNARNIGRSRPDLIGQDTSQAWHAFETKGRSSAPSAADKQKAKEQAQRLSTVNGSPCSLHIGSFAFFRGDELEFYWRDPEPEEPENLEPIEIRIADVDWAHYYAPALALASESVREALPFDAEGVDLTIEVHHKLHDLLFEGQWAAARSRAIEMRQVLEADGFKPDGLRVIAGESWLGRFKVGLQV
jgi:hypothetical protein